LLGITAVKQLHQLLPFPGHDSALYCKTIYSEQTLLRINLTYHLSLLSLNAFSGTVELHYLLLEAGWLWPVNCKYVVKVKLMLRHVWSALVRGLSLISDRKHVSSVTLDCKHFPEFCNGLHMVW